MTKKIIPSSPLSIKKCTFENCERKRFCRGLCAPHYYTEVVRPKTTHKPRLERNGCDVIGCNKPHHAKGLCKLHAKRMLLTGTTDLRVKTVETLCSKPDCNKTRRARTLCVTHYRRLMDALRLETNAQIRLCSLPDCEFKHMAKGLCGKHYGRFRKYGDPNFLLIKPYEGNTKEERFWNRVNKNAPNGCWEWIGRTKTRSGYGMVYGNGKQVPTHRYAWYLTYGVEPRLHLLHSCDNPPCVNPAHLREGTPKENSADMLARKRHKPLRGVMNGNAKLTNSQVTEIRELAKQGQTQVKLAQKFNVSKSTIHLVVSNKRYIQ